MTTGKVEVGELGASLGQQALRNSGNEKKSSEKILERSRLQRNCLSAMRMFTERYTEAMDSSIISASDKDCLKRICVASMREFVGA